MSDLHNRLMTVDDFLLWAEKREGGHYELVDGSVHAMAPEQAGHARAKGDAYVALKTAIARAASPCEAMPDGMTVRIDATSAYEPDALVYCGKRLQRRADEVPDPVIVVEVLSPSTGRFDRFGKLPGYFKVPSLRHYVIVDLDHRVVIHHGRTNGEIATHILGSGPLRLDPPGLDLVVEDLLGPVSDEAE